MNSVAYTFQLGTFRCTALFDGMYDYTAERFVANGDPREVAEALDRHHVTADRIPSPYTCLLVDTGRELVLLDTGGAGWSPTVGKLESSLRSAGFDPDNIDVVVLTHGHPDHIGGNTDAAGAPIYRNAKHVMTPAEWAYWTSPETLARVPERFAQIAQKNLPPLEQQLELVAGETEVVPGIRMLPTPGHTPGHAAVILESGGEELLYISDAALHPMHLEHPGWHPVFDVEPDRALASKRMLLERAASGMLVLAYHFDPFPCLGHIVPWRSGWTWEPVAEGGDSIASGGGAAG